MNVLEMERKTEIEPNIHRNFVYENCSNSLGQKWTFKINDTGKLGSHFKKLRQKDTFGFIPQTKHNNPLLMEQKSKCKNKNYVSFVKVKPRRNTRLKDLSA